MHPSQLMASVWSVPHVAAPTQWPRTQSSLYSRTWKSYPTSDIPARQLPGTFTVQSRNFLLNNARVTRTAALNPGPQIPTAVSAQASSASAESDPYVGVSLYKPATYEVIVQDAARAVEFGIADGIKRMEVEFPPLPSTMSSYKGASDDFIDANLQLALALARRLTVATGKKVKLVLPDKPERRRAARILNSALTLAGGITLGCLDDVPGVGGGGGWLGAARDFLDLDFGGGNDEDWSSDAPCHLFLLLNASTAELPACENYLNHFATADSFAVLFNLELDTLRADLGLVGFPQKEIHYRFLSKVTPVFYIRTRDYSKSVPVAPFILNYSGCLLRQYPGPWQVMLKQSDASYVCVAEGSDRFTLGEVKQELLLSLGLEEEKGSTLEFLRRGFKTMTWWEEDRSLEESAAWRS